jgi:hypothetical protein
MERPLTEHYLLPACKLSERTKVFQLVTGPTRFPNATSRNYSQIVLESILINQEGLKSLVQSINSLKCCTLPGAALKATTVLSVDTALKGLALSR